MEAKKYRKDEKPTGDIICEPLVKFKYETLVLDPAKRYSYADYLTWVDDKRRELFDGFVKMMAGTLTLHSRFTTNMTRSAWSFIRRRKGQCKIFQSPIDFRLPKNGETADDKIFTVVQPDTAYDMAHTPDAKIPVHTVKGLKIALKELFED